MRIGLNIKVICLKVAYGAEKRRYRRYSVEHTKDTFDNRRAMILSENGQNGG